MYIFYDTEATGLDLDFTQLLQVAMVFTDDDLNILSSKKIECGRAAWVVPSPGAMLITGFTPDDLKNSKLSHYDMMKELDAWARAQHWPVIFAGYNSLGFDEPALANNLGHNLLDPGLTTAASPQGGSANSRIDIFPMVKAVATYMPGFLTLDIKNDYGSPSLSLLNVAKQNGVALSDAEAHDAMNDIKATLGVAKLIKNGAPAIWEQMLRLSTPAGVDAFAAATHVFAYSDFSYGKNKTVAATAVTATPQMQVVFDLSVDPAPYLNMSESELATVMRRAFDRRNNDPAPFSLVSKSAQPAMMPLSMADAVLPKDFDDAAAQGRAATIAQHSAFQARVAAAAQKVVDSRKWAPHKPLAEQLVHAPVADAVRPRLQAWIDGFHGAPDWKARAAKIDEFYTAFSEDMKEDPDLRRFVRFAGRIVFDNAPEALSEERRRNMMEHIAQRMLNPNPKAPYMTVPKARAELEKIEKERANGAAKWKDVTDTQIRALKLYYTSFEKELTPFLPPVSNDNAAAPSTPSQENDLAPAVKKLADKFRPK